MEVYEAIKKRRTIRKFTQQRVEREQLLRLADCARLAAYGANMQPIRLRFITDGGELEKIFPMIKWAGYLTDGAPKDGEKPTAYIAVLGDMSSRPNGAFETDAGAAVTSMMLEAVEMGLATCWLGAIDRTGISRVLELDEDCRLLYLLAVGYPAQESRECEMTDGNVKYYEDENGVINVPKRAIEDIIIN